jgi:hypothetical protein
MLTRLEKNRLGFLKRQMASAEKRYASRRTTVEERRKRQMEELATTLGSEIENLRAEIELLDEKAAQDDPEALAL